MGRTVCAVAATGRVDSNAELLHARLKMPSLWQCVSLACGLTHNVGIFLYCKTLFLAWPSKLRSFIPNMKSGNESLTLAGMKYMSSTNFLWQRTRRAVKNMGIAAEEGEPYPDFPLIELKNRYEQRLSDLVKSFGAQPVVLNFGSCS